MVEGTYPATVVAMADSIPGSCGMPGGVVVAFTGANGTTPGEQIVVAPEDLTSEPENCSCCGLPFLSRGNLCPTCRKAK
jgi:hypothetical protein